MKLRIILICLLFIIASLLGIFAQDLGFIINDPTGYGNIKVFEWSTYLSWIIYFVMAVLIILSFFMNDAKDIKVKVLFAVVHSSGILVSVWSLFVISMSV